MKAKQYEYARRVWICALLTSDIYGKQCDIGGNCHYCEWAEQEKQREAEDEELLKKEMKEAEG